MLIKENELSHWIENFYGYGSWEAKLWFIGYEENGGDAPEEVAEKLGYFYKTHPAGERALCNIRELFRQVGFRAEGPRGEIYDNHYEYRFGVNGKTLHGAWKNMIAFVHGYQNKKLPDLLAYQKKSFAAPDSHEALLHLYPLPAHNHAWYYAWLNLSDKFYYLKSRKSYAEHLYPQRIKQILDNIRIYKPKVVVMYGMENINALKQSVQSHFPSKNFKMVKGIKLQIPQHHITEINDTILLVTTQIPSLRHRRVETGFDWYEFGRLVSR